jgi:molybdopterin-guanine dinucleotide biosynthesis protein MobB
VSCGKIKLTAKETLLLCKIEFAKPTLKRRFGHSLLLVKVFEFGRRIQGMVLIVAAVGTSGSGKTTTIEYLISRFSEEGYSVGAVKHIHHKGFSMDREGTNTWRYAQAGSKVIVAISPQEIDVIKKTERELKDLDQILALLGKERLDVVFIEGFHNLIAKRADIPKIVTAKDQEELKRALEGTMPPILAATGLVSQDVVEPRFGEVPFIKVPQEGEKLYQLIRAQLEK